MIMGKELRIILRMNDRSFFIAVELWIVYSHAIFVNNPGASV